MMVLTQKQLDGWLEEIKSSSTLVAPVDSNGKLVYKPVDSLDQIQWDFTRPDMPPRNWVLPMTETILFIEQGSTTTLTNPPTPKQVVLFGVRPCDARSLTALDALFLKKEPVDPIYQRHRQQLCVIGLACSQMWDSCFCTVVGGAPDGQDGLDILLNKIDEGYSVQLLTEKGKEVASGLPKINKKVTLPKPTLHKDSPVLRKSVEWNQLFNDLFWEQLSHTCLSCRACSFVCPTCRCYDVRDELVAIKPGLKEFERLRAWDSCTAVGYRRAAGGHNPRDTQAKRLRNRFYCKFVYYPEDFGPMGCVGCGRCIDACPVGINILEVINEVDHLLKKEAVN